VAGDYQGLAGFSNGDRDWCKIGGLGTLVDREVKCWQSSLTTANLCLMNQMSAVIDEHKRGLAEQCRRFGVRRLEVFGSATRGDFDPGKSDVDFIVSFADKTPGTYADRYLDFAAAIEQLLGRKIDLLTERCIRNPYFRREVEAARQIVYDERGQEAAP
jgi:uncharacterized protein